MELPRNTNAPPDPYYNLTKAIVAKYESLAQSRDDLRTKLALRQSLWSQWRKTYPNLDLYIVGSSANNLALKNSDTDICCVISTADSSQAVNILAKIRDILCNDPYNRYQKIDLIQAKVPLLKFNDNLSRIQVDLNVNNVVGIRNTRLIKAYTECDPRVAKLIVAVKVWARENGINNAHHQTLSSYSLTLMVLHYLQVVDPPVLPSFQKIAPQRFHATDDFTQYTLHEKWPRFDSENEMSLGQLFVGFLKYFAEDFDFTRSVVSVRVGHKISKEAAKHYASDRNLSTHWKFIGIEEPFDRTNTAAAVFDESRYILILKVLKESYILLSTGRSFEEVTPLPEVIFTRLNPIIPGYPDYPPPATLKVPLPYHRQPYRE